MAYGSPHQNRRGWPTSTFSKRPRWKSDLDKHPLGQILDTLNVAQLEPTPANSSGDSSQAIIIKDFQHVASYNWTNSKSPTILFPGKPPLWTPLKQPCRLDEDDGTYFRDPNAARFPSHPTEPAVQALLNTKPNFSTEEVDIFACGSTMGNLLRFVRRIDKPFRFHVEVIGSTVFFIRKENDPREVIEDVRGYGHTFPEAYTTWESEVKGSESHQRLIQYTFGGLKCIIRFESDGYLGDLQLPDNTPKSPLQQEPSMNGLLTTLNNAHITTPLPTSDSTLNVRCAGSPVPQATLFDLKTRSGRRGKEIDMSDIHPLLWLKQIPNFIVAYHDGRGIFHDIRVQDVRQDVQAWEGANQDGIQRLAVLLGKLVDVARRDGDGLLEVYSPCVDQLEVRRQAGRGVHALPAELRARWEGNAGAESDDESDVDDSGGDDSYEEHRDGKNGVWLGYDSEDEEPDYTACSAEDCGYCGKCTY